MHWFPHSIGREQLGVCCDRKQLMEATRQCAVVKKSLLAYKRRKIEIYSEWPFVSTFTSLLNRVLMSHGLNQLLYRNGRKRLPLHTSRKQFHHLHRLGWATLELKNSNGWSSYWGRWDQFWWDYTRAEEQDQLKQLLGKMRPVLVRLH